MSMNYQFRKEALERELEHVESQRIYMDSEDLARRAKDLKYQMNKLEIDHAKEFRECERFS